MAFFFSAVATQEKRKAKSKAKAKGKEEDEDSDESNDETVIPVRWLVPPAKNGLLNITLKLTKGCAQQ